VKKGFTLIELLVVIAIIGVLSSIVISSFNSARTGARDAKRLEEFYSIRNALELYYSDFGRYPSPPAGTCNTSLGDVNCINLPAGTDWSVGSGISVLTSGGYIGEIPKDPVNDAAKYNYHLYKACPDGQNYILQTLLEKGPKKYYISGGSNPLLILEDIDNNGTINIFDMAAVSICMGLTTQQCIMRADLNGDGVVNMSDLNMVHDNFGQSCL
jgi:prepilin-type N-terminal cleavage/methylation domain-containing protein